MSFVEKLNLRGDLELESGEQEGSTLTQYPRGAVTPASPSKDMRATPRVRENLGAGAMKAWAPIRVETVRRAAVFCSEGREEGKEGGEMDERHEELDSGPNTRALILLCVEERDEG